jgi:large subunit ribosomal protein L29
MKTKEIRDLALEEMEVRIADTRLQIVENRFKQATNKLTNVAVIRQARKTLARLLTIQTEEINKAKDGKVVEVPKKSKAKAK